MKANHIQLPDSEIYAGFRGGYRSELNSFHVHMGTYLYSVEGGRHFSFLEGEGIVRKALGRRCGGFSPRNGHMPGKHSQACGGFCEICARLNLL